MSNEEWSATTHTRSQRQRRNEVRPAVPIVPTKAQRNLRAANSRVNRRKPGTQRWQLSIAMVAIAILGGFAGLLVRDINMFGWSNWVWFAVAVGFIGAYAGISRPHRWMQLTVLWGLPILLGGVVYLSSR